MRIAVVVRVDETIVEFEPFRKYTITSVWTGLPLSIVIPLALSIAIVICCTL